MLKPVIQRKSSGVIFRQDKTQGWSDVTPQTDRRISHSYSCIHSALDSIFFVFNLLGWGLINAFIYGQNKAQIWKYYYSVTFFVYIYDKLKVWGHTLDFKESTKNWRFYGFFKINLLVHFRPEGISSVMTTIESCVNYKILSKNPVLIRGFYF